MKFWQRNYSLRHRVLTGLFVATIGYWSIIATLTVEDNMNEVHELYDIHLAHTALALLRVNDPERDAATPVIGEAATGTIKQLFQQWPDLPQHVTPGLPLLPATEPPHTSSGLGISNQIVERNVDHGLTLRYQLWRSDGFLMFQSINAPRSPITEKLGFSKYTDADGKVWRNYSIWDAKHQVRAVVSEGNDDRMQLVRSIAIQSMNPIVLGMPLFILLLWLSVRSGLGPLTDLSLEISKRDTSSLVLLEDGKSPRELQPIVRALNNLIQRMIQTLENERSFNANAAHELNTPLAAIQAHLYVARNAKSESERQHALEQAQTGVERGARLVSQMLALARLDPKLPHPDLNPVNLGDIAQNVCAELAPLALRRDQTLELEVAPQAVLLAGNADLLHRLIGNLVDNAIRYASREGHIHVEVESLTKGLRLSVIDDGPGIPAEQLAHVFKRYYRLADEARNGTGLGLAICRNIVDIHHAEISLSQGPGGRGLSVQVDFFAPT
jgi:two-component system sensor histidine kinase QseC